MARLLAPSLYLLMERRWKVSKLTRPHWPDEVRLKMIEKSEFYSEPQVYQYGFYDGFQHAQSQTQELTAWKESASKVFKNLDLQAIGKTLGIVLGEDVSTNVLPKIRELQERNAELVEMLERVLALAQCGNIVEAYKIEELLTKYKKP